ncbi:MAG: DoxX family protein [Pseudonocardia sp.]
MSRSDQPAGIVSLEAANTERISTDAVRAALAEDDRAKRRPPLTWTGGLDLGLLIIRLTLGGVFFVHGIGIVFGRLNGPGIEGFARGLSGLGYRETNLLAWVTGVTELAGAVLLIFGLFTPLAAAALLGIVINSILVKYSVGFFVQPDNPSGYELDVLLGGMAAGLLFAGPGRIALDKGTTWFRRPLLSGTVCLVLGVVAAVLIYLFLRR